MIIVRRLRVRSKGDGRCIRRLARVLKGGKDTIFQSGDKEQATGKLIKFLQAAWRKAKGWHKGRRVGGRRSAGKGPLFRPWEYCN